MDELTRQGNVIAQATCLRGKVSDPLAMRKEQRAPGEFNDSADSFPFHKLESIVKYISIRS